MSDAAKTNTPGRGLHLSELSPKRISGFMLDRFWMLMLFYSTIPYFGSSDYREALYLNLALSLAIMVPVVYALAFLAYKRDLRLSKAPSARLSGALMLIGTLMLPFADCAAASGVALLVISSVLTGIGSGMLLIAWCTTFVSARSNITIIEVALSYLLASLLALASVFLPTTVAIGLIAAAPVVSAYLLWSEMRPASASTADANPATTLADNEPEAPLAGHGRTVGYILAGLALFGFASGFSDTVSGFRTFAIADNYGTALMLGTFLATVLAVAVLAFSRKQSGLKLLRIAVLLTIVGCLCIHFVQDGFLFSNVIVFAGYVCLEITVIALVSSAAKRRPHMATALFGVTFGSMYLGEVIGANAAHLLDGVHLSPNQISIISIVLAVILIVDALFLLTDYHIVQLTGRRAGKIAAAADSVGKRPEELFDNGDKTAQSIFSEELCEKLADEGGLSKRERDVLPLLLKGRTIARIQEELFISAGTVNTHTRHIYQKLDVHDRQQLLDLAESRLSR